ncbi:MAG: hypothetical protein R3274_09100 [Desulfobacterales bacterium]|nr:hypothetical protein [Desulfobacterales bacterium]
MIYLKIDDLKPGMVLASSVYNQQDLLLLEKGTALTRRRIWMLKTWGVDKVGVKGRGQKDESSDDRVVFETRESIERELQAKFSDVIDDPVMQEIMKAASRQLQKRLTDPDRQNEST